MQPHLRRAPVAIRPQVVGGTLRPAVLACTNLATSRAHMYVTSYSCCIDSPKWFVELPAGSRYDANTIEKMKRRLQQSMEVGTFSQLIQTRVTSLTSVRTGSFGIIVLTLIGIGTARYPVNTSAYILGGLEG